jgi:tetratricopeptide (TPR) repeat protein
MKQLTLSIIFIGCFFFSGLADPTPVIADLLHAIDQAPTYDSIKTKRIEGLKQAFYTSDNSSTITTFNLADQLYNEYKVFNYDSAYLYAGKMQQLAMAANNFELINEARLRYVFIMLSGGLFRETFDTLSLIKTAGMSDEDKATYYTLMGRYYYDLASYENDKYHSVNYDIRASHYIDSAINYYPENSFERIYYSGLKLFKQGKPEASIQYFEKILSDPNLPDHQLALTTSTLAGVYLQKGETAKGIDLLTRAAIADIHASTKETYAIYNLAELLYKQGNTKEASLCIEKAIADAEFYNARQRKAQISSIYGLIESERIHAIEAQRRLAVQYGIAVTIFLLVLAILIIVIRRQINKLQQAKKIITEAHELQQQVNDKLGDANAKLEEANKIKEEYIGYFFKLDSEYFSRLEKLKNMIEKKLQERKFEDIHFILSNIKPQKEKKELLVNFDKVFLRIFPNFVTSFNSFFKEEDRIKLSPDELLNTDLRVFALIRIGISENEKIAEILDYSINTIYSYKTRIKNKSIILNDDFEKKVMEIKSV